MEEFREGRIRVPVILRLQERQGTKGEDIRHGQFTHLRVHMIRKGATYLSSRVRMRVRPSCVSKAATDERHALRPSSSVRPSRTSKKSEVRSQWSHTEYCTAPRTDWNHPPASPIDSYFVSSPVNSCHSCFDNICPHLSRGRSRGSLTEGYPNTVERPSNPVPCPTDERQDSLRTSPARQCRRKWTPY